MGEVLSLLEKETGHILVAGEANKEAPWAREYQRPCRPTSRFVSFSPAARAATSAPSWSAWACGGSSRRPWNARWASSSAAASTSVKAGSGRGATATATATAIAPPTWTAPEGEIPFAVPQVSDTADEPFASKVRRHVKGRTDQLGTPGDGDVRPRPVHARRRGGVHRRAGQQAAFTLGRQRGHRGALAAVRGLRHARLSGLESPTCSSTGWPSA